MLPRRHHVDAHTASWWRRRARRRARATAPVLIHLCLLGQVFLVGCFGETSTSAWTVRATALQRYLGYDVPLDKLTLTATHNSFTSDRDPLTHSNFEVVPAQIYSVTDQLSCLGVRGIELDPHYIVELATDGNEKSAVRLCHTSALAATQVIEVCDTFGWDLCEEAGVPNFGTNTGCREDAPTLREGFEEIAVWLSLEENAQEVVFIKLDSYLDDQVDLVSLIAADVFNETLIFSPADWKDYSDNDEWPSPQELVELGRRVVLAGDEPSELVFSTESDVTEEVISAVDFRAGTCSERDDYPEPAWTRVQGDIVQYRLSRFNSTIFEVVPPEREALNENQTGNVLICGHTPTFDRIDTQLSRSTLWSWDAERPETGFGLPRAAVVSSASGGRWIDRGTDAEEGEFHGVACRDEDSSNRYYWDVVPIYNSSSSSLASEEDDSEDDEDDDEDDEGGYEYSGEFAGAEDACSSLGDGWVFSAPRTAFENMALRRAMSTNGVETVWVHYTSDGDDLGDSLCWSREWEQAYCVSANDICSGAPTQEIIPTGEIPSVELADWENDTYIRPSYSITPTVRNLNGWVRVAGGNEFDVSDRDYVIGIILAAAPLFVFGFIVACCCLPVGHIAAGSKQHHVDGEGFFGCLCPARCKQGDFIASGTLAIVVAFTILTLIGGAMAIYGVRSVDADVVNLWENLDGMGGDMVTAQTRLDEIYERMVRVESSFPTVASCSGLPSLEAAASGVSSAEGSLGELVDANIGSVGQSIQVVNEDIKATADVRRGIVYSAGGLVLVMSIVYVVVGHYALAKDDGNGKDGGARMRGPVVIGCLFLPLTLLVILTCWFLFGLSTSFSLFTADFCMAPTEHTTGVFEDPGDKEVVSFYTSCSGTNVFSSALSTAFIQATAAKELVASVDDDIFAASCLNETATKAALELDMDAILMEIDAMGYLIQCGKVNPYFVNGVEGSLCHDAPEKVWFVTGGFAVVSVSLLVVAIAFRLLLQQKEEGLYRVVFEEDLSLSRSSSLDGQNPSIFAADGSDKQKSRRGDRSGRSVIVAIPIKETSPFDTAAASTNGINHLTGDLSGVPTLSSSTASGTGSSTLSPLAGGVSSLHQATWGQLEKSDRRRPVESMMPRPRAGLNVFPIGYRQQKARANPLEPSSHPTSPTQSTDVKIMVNGHGPEGSELGPRVSSRASTTTTTTTQRPGVAGDVSVSRSKRDDSAKDDGNAFYSEGKESNARHGAALAGGGVKRASVQPDPSSIGGTSSSYFSRFDANGHRQSGGTESAFSRYSGGGGGGGAISGVDSSGSKKQKTSRLFRALAGLDDPDIDEAPSVIVSRSSTRHGSRNLADGGDDDGPDTITFMVARAGTVVSRASTHGDVDDNRVSGRNIAGNGQADNYDLNDDHDSDYDVPGLVDSDCREGDDRKHGSVSIGVGSSRGSGRVNGSGRASTSRRGSNSGRIRAPNYLYASEQGTWAAVAKEIRRDSVLSISSSHTLPRSLRNGEGEGDGHDVSGRSCHHYPRSSSTASTDVVVSGADDAAPAHGGPEVPGFVEKEGEDEGVLSSTASGLSTGWRRPRAQIKTAAHRSRERSSSADGPRPSQQVFQRVEAGEDSGLSAAAAAVTDVGVRGGGSEGGVDAQEHPSMSRGVEYRAAGRSLKSREKQSPLHVRYDGTACEKRQEEQRSRTASRERDEERSMPSSQDRRGGQSTTPTAAATTHWSAKHMNAFMQQQRQPMRVLPVAASPTLPIDSTGAHGRARRRGAAVPSGTKSGILGLDALSHRPTDDGRPMKQHMDGGRDGGDRSRNVGDDRSRNVGDDRSRSVDDDRARRRTPIAGSLAESPRRNARIAASSPRSLANKDSNRAIISRRSRGRRTPAPK